MRELMIVYVMLTNIYAFIGNLGGDGGPGGGDGQLLQIINKCVRI